MKKMFVHLLIGLSLNGCVFSIPTDTTDVGNLYGKGKAYGINWRFIFVGKRTNYFAIDSDAFLYSDAQSVIVGDTEKIVLSESVYVLQRDGGYKQVEFREPISSIVAYWADDKMYISVAAGYSQPVKTECESYRGEVSNFRNQGDYDGWYFGEYDVSKKAFLLNQFQPLIIDVKSRIHSILKSYDLVAAYVPQFAIPLICDPNVDIAQLEQQHRALEAKLDALIEQLKAEKQAAANSP